MTELIRATEAARRLNKSRQVVYKLIEKGLLDTVQIAGMTLIDADSLTKTEITDRKSGRPRKSQISTK